MTWGRAPVLLLDESWEEDLFATAVQAILNPDHCLLGVHRRSPTSRSPKLPGRAQPPHQCRTLGTSTPAARRRAQVVSYLTLQQQAQTWVPPAQPAPAAHRHPEAGPGGRAGGAVRAGNVLAVQARQEERLWQPRARLRERVPGREGGVCRPKTAGQTMKLPGRAARCQLNH